MITVDKRRELKNLKKLILNHEDWLTQRVLQYARERNYVKYTSTLAEAWRISVANLSNAIVTAIESDPQPPELGPDDDYTQDPIASFGVQEAQKHRARGLTIGMFMSLMKYYQQSYLDLIDQSGFGPKTRKHYRYFVERCFDHIELGFCTEWAAATENEQLEALQAANRLMTNEKNKYLTIFESLHDPAILLDRNNRVINMNHAAATLFTGASIPGDIYYDQHYTAGALPWLAEELAALAVSEEPKFSCEKTFETPEGLRSFDVKLERMLDVSEKFSGTVVLLYDLTEHKRAAVMEERERLARDLHDSITQSLYSLTLFAEWGRGLLEAGESDLAQERLNRIAEIAQQALKEMRLLLYELRPSALEQDGLIGALQRRLAAVEGRAGVEISLETDLSLDLPPLVEEGLYHITQEALNNALKHAAATSVVVRVQGNSQGMVLEVQDDGLGFNPADVSDWGGMGLDSMHERAERLGGVLEVISAAGQGTRVTAYIPAEALP
jgi:signal transduction histidine kinase